MEAITLPEPKGVTRNNDLVFRDKYIFRVGFEIPTAVTTKSTSFWALKPCSPVEVRRFGRTFRLHFRCQKSKAINLRICKPEDSILQ
jgi:hypothetical protein